MLSQKLLLALLCGVFTVRTALADISSVKEEIPETPIPVAQSLIDAPTNSFFDSVKKHIGITYFSFFYGPGLDPDHVHFNPNWLGNPQNDGVYFQNQISLRFKLSDTLAIDFQSRINMILNNATNNPNYSFLRWEAPRIGISGKLASGEDWTLVGAVNTDFPYFLPEPFTGYQAQLRTVIFNPGMFASFKFEPKNSRWSVFSVVNPRYFFYTDRNAAESQMQRSGLIPQNKPELIISFLPTVNYRIGERTKITLGTSIDYRKQVVSDWNIFDASLISNGSSPAWRLTAIPINVGITHTFSESFTIFPFISFYPIAAQRQDANTGAQATFLEATSFGMWLSGTIF